MVEMSLLRRWRVMPRQIIVPALALAGFTVTLCIFWWQQRAEPPPEAAPIQAVATWATPHPTRAWQQAPPPAIAPAAPAPMQSAQPANVTTAAQRAQSSRAENPNTPGYYLHSHRDM